LVLRDESRHQEEGEGRVVYVLRRERWEVAGEVVEGQRHVFDEEEIMKLGEGLQRR